MLATNSRFLAHRKVLVEAEALRHVSDVALDLVGPGCGCRSRGRCRARVGREQAAQHADGGGLAGAVGSEKAVDRAALHLHREVAHDLTGAEGLAQSVHVDRDVGRGLTDAFRARCRPADRHAALRLGRPRLDHEDELRSLFEAVDHRRGEFGGRGDEAHRAVGRPDNRRTGSWMVSPESRSSAASASARRIAPSRCRVAAAR